MAKKTETKLVERTYTIPLRKEFRKVPNWKQTKKAVTATKEFLVKHMKSENVKLGKALNEKLWQHGIKNPPAKVKVNVTKDEKGVVKAELFGAKLESKKVEKKQDTPNDAAKKTDSKETQKTNEEPLKKATPVKEEKMPEIKDDKATQATPNTENNKN